MKKRISQTYRVFCSIYIFRDSVKINKVFSQILPEEEKGIMEVVETLVKRMETLLKTPECKLTVQGEEIKTNGPND